MPLPLTEHRPSPPNRTCRIAFEGAYGDARWANVMWLYLTGSGEITTANVGTLATGAFNAYAANLQGHLSSSCVLDTCIASLYFNDDLFVNSHTGSAAGGDSIGDNSSANVALGISWVIPSHYRGGHPRTYLCGIRSNHITDPTTFGSAFVSAIQGAASDFHDALEALGPIGDGIATVEHGIVSFQRNKEWRTPPLFRRIVDATVDNRVDTQRRRLGRDR